MENDDEDRDQREELELRIERLEDELEQLRRAWDERDFTPPWRSRHGRDYECIAPPCSQYACRNPNCGITPPCRANCGITPPCSANCGIAPPCSGSYRRCRPAGYESDYHRGGRPSRYDSDWQRRRGGGGRFGSLGE